MRIGTVVSLFYRLARCQSGNFAAIFAICAPVFLGLSGGAVDLYVFNNQKSQMQNAADAAVLAATREASLKNWSTNEAQAVALSYVESKLADVGLSTAAKVSVSTVVDTAARKVGITVDMDQYRYFLLGYFRKSPQIRVTATAQLSSETPVCLVALDKIKAKSVNVVDEANFLADGCAAYSNSVAKDGLFVASTARLVAAYSCSGGGFGSGSAVFTPTPTTDCPPFADPLDQRPQPSVGACDYNNFAIKKTVATIYPGVYCGGILIDNKAEVTMRPGVYIIKDGALASKNSGVLKGDDVTIFFTGVDGRLEFDGSTTINLTAPATGPTAGLLMMQDRAMGLTDFEISSKVAAQLLGTIYLPNAHLKIRAPGKVADQSAFTVIVANSVEVGASTKMYLNSNYSATPVPTLPGLGPSKLINLVN